MWNEVIPWSPKRHVMPTNMYDMTGELVTLAAPRRMVEEAWVHLVTNSNILEFRRASITATWILSRDRAKSPHQQLILGCSRDHMVVPFFICLCFHCEVSGDKHRVFLATNGTVGERGMAPQESEGTATLTTPRSMSESQQCPQPAPNPPEAGSLRAF